MKFCLVWQMQSFDEYLQFAVAGRFARITSMNLGRSDFVKGACAFVGLAAGGCRNLIRSGARDYSVSILGDLHYDTSPSTVYHAEFIKLFRGTDQHPARFREFERNAAMWKGPSRKILEASGRCVTGDTALVLQMGDLIQGDCNDALVHRKMLDETASVIKSAFPAALPFVTTCGNHDIREGGAGRNMAAAPVYSVFARDFNFKELGERIYGTIESSTFAFRQGPDLYLVMDFNLAKQQMGLVKRILEENSDVRYTFVVTHGGVFPFDSWARRWFYLGEENANAERREMRKVFARHNAIVLCGHTHYLELKDAEFPEGRITEMTMNSVPYKTNGGEFPAEPLVLREGADSYGDVDWVKSDATTTALFKEYRPYMRRYWLAEAAGHAKLRVSDDGVWFDYYGRDSVAPTRVFKLR